MDKFKRKVLFFLPLIFVSFPVRALEVLENDNYIYLNNVPFSKELLSILYRILNINLFILLAMIGGIVAFLTLYSFFIALVNKASLFNLFGIIFNLIRPKRYWGIVFDEKNLSPIGFARVRLTLASIDSMNLTKKVVASTLTNYQGKYFFRVNL